MKKPMQRLALLALAGALAACAQEPTDDATAVDTAAADTNADTGTYEGDPSVDAKVMSALETCKNVEPTCADGNPAGYFVFPDVTSVALGVGGAGGEGALVQDGKITGYYKMGQGSIGLQAGVSAASFVLKVGDPATLKEYQSDGEWSIGADAGVTVIQAGATAQGQTAGEKVELYVFNSEGLMGDVSVNGMKIWKWDDAVAGQRRDRPPAEYPLIQSTPRSQHRGRGVLRCAGIRLTQAVFLLQNCTRWHMGPPVPKASARPDLRLACGFAETTALLPRSPRNPAGDG